MKRLQLVATAALAALVIGAVAYGLGWMARHGAEDERRWREHAEYALQMGKAYRELQAAGDRELEAARAEAEQARRATQREVARVDSLEREIVALEGNTEEMATPEARADHFEGLYRMRTEQQMATAAALLNMGRERDALGRQVGVLTAQRDSARARVAQLEAVVDEGLKVRECRILGLVSCPSRTATFFGGAVAGVVVKEGAEALLRSLK